MHAAATTAGPCLRGRALGLGLRAVAGGCGLQRRWLLLLLPLLLLCCQLRLLEVVQDLACKLHEVRAGGGGSKDLAYKLHEGGGRGGKLRSF